MKTNDTHLLFLYETGQVPLALPYIKSGTYTVVALDYEVELELAKVGVQFVSLMSIARSIEGDRDIIEKTRALGRLWYEAPDMSFYAYDGIKLGEQYEAVVFYYIQTAVYWISMLEQVFDHYSSVDTVSVFESLVFVPPTADPTAVYKERIVADTVMLLAKRRAMTATIIPAPLSARSGSYIASLKGKAVQFMARIVTAVWNMGMAFRPAQPIRMFATDPWSRIEPVFAHLPDAEVVMSRRQEMRGMVPHAAWRTRARFHHRLDFAAKSYESTHTAAAAIAEQWRVLVTPSFAAQFEHRGVSYWPLVKAMLDTLIGMHAEDAIATIESTKYLFAKHRINVVLLLASNKGYNNLVARVAERMNIPSIELQHALGNNEKSLVHCRLNTRYLAGYGPLTRRMYESWGVESWRIFDCGSPRFDRYFGVPSTPRPESSELTALFIAPFLCSNLEVGSFTSYEARYYTERVANLQREFPLRVLVRPHPGKVYDSFYNQPALLDLFPGEKELVPHDDLRALLARSDMVISGNSTVVLESLFMHKPVIMYGVKSLDHDFDEFEQAGVVLMARTTEELERHVRTLSDPEERRALAQKGDEFVIKNFMHDGNSAQRVAASIRTVAIGSPQTKN